MEYVKGKPYFCINSQKIKSYPYLNDCAQCDILILGGGIDGAITNFYLSQKYDVILVDKSRFGYGCTTCATALLEYQLDDYAEDLLSELTEQQIVDVYNMGLYSIDKIERFVNEYGNHCDFYRRPTLLFSDNLLSSGKVVKEYEFRKKHSFDVKLITEENNTFGFPIKKGLYCEDGGCEFNPYLFTKQLIENAANQDKIFENTEIDTIERKRDKYILTTNYGDIITCNKVIIASGFNWEVLNRSDLCERFISYTIVVKPNIKFDWYKRTLIQDDLDPYHYLRMLPDDCIIYGGEDTVFKEKPIDEDLADKKYLNLEKSLLNLFPELEDNYTVISKFCGCFGSTDNNLGLIGETDQKNLFYCFSCGANGIINAMYGVEIIDDILQKKRNKLETVFSPVRA